MNDTAIVFLNPVGTSAVKLQEQIKLLNEKFGFDFKLTENQEYSELQKMVGEAQNKAKAILEKNGGNNSETKKKGNAVYVWVKSPAYVDKDGTKRIGGGLFLIDIAKFPRLEKMPKTVCEMLGEEVDARKLGEIAKWFGVNLDKHDDNELLDILVKEPTLY